MKTVAELAHRLWMQQPAVQVSADALRYRTIRGMSAEQVYMLISATMLDHEQGESFEAAYDRHLDKIVISKASEQGVDYPARGKAKP